MSDNDGDLDLIFGSIAYNPYLNTSYANPTGIYLLENLGTKVTSTVDVDVEISGVQAYPIPAKAFPNIRGLIDDKAILLNSTGDKVSSFNLSNGVVNIININDFAKGIYFLRVSDEN